VTDDAGAVSTYSCLPAPSECIEPDAGLDCWCVFVNGALQIATYCPNGVDTCATAASESLIFGCQNVD
jgi:hypothetical protein